MFFWVVIYNQNIINAIAKHPYPLVIKHGNWKSTTFVEFFHVKINYKWVIFFSHMWLPKGNKICRIQLHRRKHIGLSGVSSTWPGGIQPEPHKDLFRPIHNQQYTNNKCLLIYHCWLVVSTPLKNISQLGLLFPICGKIKNVPNHQPDWGFTELEHGCCFSSPRDMKKQSSYHDNIHIYYKHYNQIYSVYAPIYPKWFTVKWENTHPRFTQMTGISYHHGFMTVVHCPVALPFSLPVRTVIPGPATMTWDDKRGHHLGHGSPWPKKRTSHPPSESRFPQEK